MQRTQRPRSEYNSGDKELEQTKCIASLWLQWIIFWSKSQLGSSWSRWSSSSSTDSAYVFRGRRPIILTDLQQQWRYNRWAGPASSRSPPLLEAKAPAFEEKKEKLTLVLEEITFAARSRTGIGGEAMAMRQRAPSVSPPMVGAVLGDSRFLIWICEQLGFFFFFFSWVLRPWLGSLCLCLWRLSPFLSPSPLCQLRPWYPLLPLFRCGRLGQLPIRLDFFVSSKSWAYCDGPCSGCGAIFHDMVCLVISGIKSLSCFSLWWFFLPFGFPSPPLGLDVRGGSLSVFHFGLLGSMDPYHFVMRSANYFSFTFGLFCLRPIHHCCLNIYFYLFLVVSCPPHSEQHHWTPKN